ncbi:F-box domain-containing protein [Trichophyton interdigitale]|nr:F-box domain-containing protein [Trichophyton interdigitale]KAG8212295.1 F-box domain-containing protein [Trichophyton interdigitale]
MALPNLPIELMEIIAKELDSNDLFNFRLVARAINTKVRYHFMKKYFSIRRHMMNTHSLQTLCKISEHPYLRRAVRTLEISSDHLSDRPPPYLQEEHTAPYRLLTPTTIDDGEYRRNLDEQSSMQNTGLDIALLARALNNLSNCHDVALRAKHDVLPWGAATLQKQTGAFPMRNFNERASRAFVERAIWAVLASLSTCPYQVYSFRIVLNHPLKSVCPEMLNFSTVNLGRLGFRFTKVKRLHLLLEPESEVSPDIWARDLANFIECFPNVHDFGLHFVPKDRRQFRAVSKALRLPRLQALELGRIHCCEADLIELLLSHKSTLKRIGFQDINLITGGDAWKTLIRAIRDHLSVERLTIKMCKLDRVPITAMDYDSLGTVALMLTGDRRELDHFVDTVRESKDGL